MNALTPDASDAERRAIFFGGLRTNKINADPTATVTDSGFPYITIEGSELSVPLRLNTPRQEAQDWLTPYLLLDFHG